jgi:T-complex protein 1 subunit epsilon
MLVFREPSQTKSVSILIRGGSKTIIDEAHRSIHDALCVIRNLIKNPHVIVGGGASELSSSIYLRKIADQTSSVEQYAIRAFASALEQIPLILADNSGMNANEALQRAKTRQIQENNPQIGISCLTAEVDNMANVGVFETLVSKKHQVQLAAQVVKMILKIDDLVEQVSF